MEIVILVIHIILALAIIGVVLLQPPENSSLGGLGGSNPMAAFGSRGQGNLLTRATAILATLFIITSLVLAIMAGHQPQRKSILEAIPAASDSAAASPAQNAPAETAPAATPVPSETPSVPLAK
jgi:preprotein translocase subunit SecG